MSRKQKILIAIPAVLFWIAIIWVVLSHLTAGLSQNDDTRTEDPTETTPTTIDTVETEAETEAETEPAVIAEIGQIPADVACKNQPAVVDITQDSLRPRYNLGTCKQLTGNPLVVALFMDDDESAWEEADVEEYTQNHLLPALAFLEEQAAAWEVELDFDLLLYASCYGDYDMQYDGVVCRNLNVKPSSKDVLEQAAQRLGFGNDWWMYSYFKGERSSSSDEIIFLTFVNDRGVTYARPIVSTGRHKDPEEAIIFRNYRQGSSFGCRAVTIVSRILTMYGAYELSPSSREDLMDEQYPTDATVIFADHISEAEICDITAYAIGWTDEEPAVLQNPDFWGK